MKLSLSFLAAFLTALVSADQANYVAEDARGRPCVGCQQRVVKNDLKWTCQGTLTTTLGLGWDRRPTKFNVQLESASDVISSCALACPVKPNQLTQQVSNALGQTCSVSYVAKSEKLYYGCQLQSIYTDFEAYNQAASPNCCPGNILAGVQMQNDLFAKGFFNPNVLTMKLHPEGFLKEGGFAGEMTFGAIEPSAFVGGLMDLGTVVGPSFSLANVQINGLPNAVAQIHTGTPFITVPMAQFTNLLATLGLPSSGATTFYSLAGGSGSPAYTVYNIPCGFKGPAVPIVINGNTFNLDDYVIPFNTKSAGCNLGTCSQNCPECLDQCVLAFAGFDATTPALQPILGNYFWKRFYTVFKFTSTGTLSNVAVGAIPPLCGHEEESSEGSESGCKPDSHSTSSSSGSSHGRPNCGSCRA